MKTKIYYRRFVSLKGSRKMRKKTPEGTRYKCFQAQKLHDDGMNGFALKLTYEAGGSYAHR
jgi:hypothetical protein